MSASVLLSKIAASNRHPEVAAMAGAASVHLAVRGPRRMIGPGRRFSRLPRLKRPGSHLRVTDHEMSVLQ
jgi:hypothetical protein